jgi:hypothetical protein
MAEMVVIVCGSCGIEYHVPQIWQKEKRNGDSSKERTFYCPNGCCRVYNDDTETKRLQRELDRQKQQNAMLAQEAIDERERRIATERSLRSTKAAKTLLKRRVGAGKCPCCSEHFPNLERHMKAAHPDGKVVPLKRSA